MSKQEDKRRKNEEEEIIEDMNKFAEETAQNRNHQKDDKVYIVHKAKNKEQKVEDNEFEINEEIKKDSDKKNQKSDENGKN